MSMGAVIAENEIARAQSVTHACSRRLLANRKMNRTPHLIARIELNDPFLKEADPEHLFE